MIAHHVRVMLKFLMDSAFLQIVPTSINIWFRTIAKLAHLSALNVLQRHNAKNANLMKLHFRECVLSALRVNMNHNNNAKVIYLILANLFCRMSCIISWLRGLKSQINYLVVPLLRYNEK